MWTLTLHRLPMSQNVRERKSHWARSAELKTITSEIGWLAKVAKIPTATTRRRVEITIHKTKRSRVLDDAANLPSRAKAPLDALVRLGLLLDDNAAGLEWAGVIEGEKRDTEQTVIRISDIKGA